MSSTLLVINLIITIAIILILILALKQSPVIALIMGSLYMGIASGVGAVTTIETIATGFGNSMTSIGISIGLGVILGKIVADSGAVQSIANGITKLCGKKKADIGLGLTGFLVSIPVFFDVAFVILMPLARFMSKHGKKIPYYAGALVGGLVIAHTFIPPTPGPLAGSEMLGLEVGTTIMWGIIIGLPSFAIALFIYNKLFLSRPGFWDPERDEEIDLEEEKKEEEKAQKLVEAMNLPSVKLGVLPILLPIVFILSGTISNAIVGEDRVPEIIKFLSNKNIAMLVGVFGAYLVTIGRLPIKEVNKTVNHALSDAGSVLLITGMGGALGAVLAAAGIGDVLVGVIETIHIHPVLFAWLVAVVLKAAQGSGTLSMITAISLLAPTVGELNVQPIFIALAAFSGSMCISIVNDSGFWITTKIARLSTLGGFKTCSLMCFIISIISLILIMGASFIF